MFVEKLAIGQPTLRAGLSGVGSVYLVDELKLYDVTSHN